MGCCGFARGPVAGIDPLHPAHGYFAPGFVECFGQVKEQGEARPGPHVAEVMEGTDHVSGQCRATPRDRPILRLAYEGHVRRSDALLHQGRERLRGMIRNEQPSVVVTVKGRTLVFEEIAHASSPPLDRPVLSAEAHAD